MILKQEITSLANTLRLLPTTVEKDYILSWVLSRNRLCVEIDYHGAKRLVEPYSLRRPKTGNLLLYVYELRKGTIKTEGIKAYKINEISNAEVKQLAFSPRYIIEL